MVFGDGKLEIHAEHVMIELDRFLRILAAIGDVVDALKVWYGSSHS